jgi:hypothetical protein
MKSRRAPPALLIKAFAVHIGSIDLPITSALSKKCHTFGFVSMIEVAYRPLPDCALWRHVPMRGQARFCLDRGQGTIRRCRPSADVAANGGENNLFGKIHISAMGGWNGSAKIE